MASNNESLIDFENEPEDNTQPPQNKSQDGKTKIESEQRSGSSNSDVKVSSKPVRTVKVSHIGIESQKNELAFSLYSAINKELRAVDTVFKRCFGHDVAIEEFDTCLRDIDVKAESITSNYAKLSQLSENKVEKNLQQYFEFFVSEVGNITEKITQRKTELTEQDEKEKREDEELRIMEEELERKKKLKEEELQKLAEYIEQRKKTSQPQSLPTKDSAADISATIVHQKQDKSDQAAAHRLIQSTPIGSSIPISPKPVQEITATPMIRGTRLLEKLDSFTMEDCPKPQVNPSPPDNNIRQLTMDLVQGLKRNRQTDIEPEVFSGNPLEFADWECDLDSYLSSMAIGSGAEKIRYLKKYVSGQARECIIGQVLIRSDESYQQARLKLKARFGNKLDVARSMRSKLSNWPKIPLNDPTALQRYADYLENCKNGMSTVPGLSILDDPQINEKMAGILPDWTRRKWATKVYQAQKNEMRYPNFAEFSAFINEEAEMASLPILQNKQQSTQGPTNTRSYGGSPQQRRGQVARAFATNNSYTQQKCLFCEEFHPTADCFRLAEKPYGQRMEFLQNKRLCFSCVETGHSSKECSEKGKYICKKCRKPGHPTCLHKRKEDWDDERYWQPRFPRQQTLITPDQHRPTDQHFMELPTTSPANPPMHNVARESPQPAEQLNDQATKLSAMNTRIPSHTKLFNMGMPVYVSSTANPGTNVLVHAILDSASTHSYITSDLAMKLKPKLLRKEPVDIETMTGETSRGGVNILGDMIIKGYYSGKVRLPSAIEWEHIPNSTGEFANNLNVLEYSHLTPLADVLPRPMDIPVGLLLGANCSSASFPLEAVRGEENQPYAVRSELGWAVYGVEEPTLQKLKVHNTTLVTNENENESMMSQDDYKFIDIMEEHTTITDTGSYQMPLPFKERPALPNNLDQARKRQAGLYKRMAKDHQFKTDYTSFMDELIDGNLAEPVDLMNAAKQGEQWYIPHFAVRHPQKQKLRVVFDCKAQFEGTALNDHLLQGPDMMNSLVGILCRFRKETIAISCDIQKMFYNFLVDPVDRDFLRFLWHDKDGQLQTYRMKVHLFGARSSPAVATYGLRKIAQDHSNVSTQAAAFIRRDFYVDDGVTSVASEQEAIDLIKAARTICGKGNLRLHKFSSSSAKVLASLPETERAVRDIDLFTDSLPEQRTLGLQWSMDSDSFKFINKIQNKSPTRRGILSVVSQLYDPLGFIAPFTLLGKNILQEINKMNIDWDEQVHEDILPRWSKWMDQLPAIEQISIPRCLKPKDFGEVVKKELHHFCDASDDGIGACSYIRQVNDRGQVHVSFLAGKSKVIPSKGLFTTPRLELMSAVISTTVSKMLKDELDMAFDNEYYWTDSKIVLGWIANNFKRFNPFVHNRIRLITSTSDVNQWFHVPGHLNPADIASRGKPVNQLASSIWFSGPEFLKEDKIDLLKQEKNFVHDLDPQDPELKKIVTLKTEVNQTEPIVKRFHKYSTWTALIRSVGILQNIYKAAPRSWLCKRPERKELHVAEIKIISEVQRHHFLEEYNSIKAGKPIAKRSPLSKLNPFIGKDGILRVGGRVQVSDVLGYGERHPILLPKNEHVSSLVVRHHHNKIHHQGRSFTLAALRSAGFWVIGATGLVKSMLRNCITCKRLRGRPAEQIMADLPAVRVHPESPFTNIGMDCFGPFLVKERRSEIKRWGLLLTCLYSRAVHVEVLIDMTMDSLINALRCFICLRGTVKTIYCDQGTNFIGASNELHKALQSMDDNSPVAKYFEDKQIKFKFNAPHASHAGGVWERQIRNIRAVLNGMLITRYKSRLDTASLRSAFYEAMAIVNSRPLSVNDLTDPQTPILTPNHLITSKTTTISSPPGVFDTTEVYGRKMWRKVQQFAEEFWETWKGDYLSQITKRQRWERPQRSVKKGDIVMLVEDNLQRNLWPYGIVEDTDMGTDGKVRKVKIRMANSVIDNRGKTIHTGSILERPIQRVVVLQESDDN